jgi:hypothetical protein
MGHCTLCKTLITKENAHHDGICSDCFHAYLKTLDFEEPPSPTTPKPKDERMANSLFTLHSEVIQKLTTAGYYVDNLIFPIESAILSQPWCCSNSMIIDHDPDASTFVKLVTCRIPPSTQIWDVEISRMTVGANNQVSIQWKQQNSIQYPIPNSISSLRHQLIERLSTEGYRIGTIVPTHPGIKPASVTNSIRLNCDPDVSTYVTLVKQKKPVAGQLWDIELSWNVTGSFCEAFIHWKQMPNTENKAEE